MFCGAVRGVFSDEEITGCFTLIMLWLSVIFASS